MIHQAPVIPSLQREDMNLFVEYMDALRADHLAAAQAEIERLGPYFNILSRQLIDDAEALRVLTPEMKRLAQKKTLEELFGHAARHTGSVILSGLVIGPEAIFSRTDTMRRSKKFCGTLKYDDKPFTFAFIQAYNEDKTASVTVPLLTLDNGMLSNTDRHHPETMLRAMQAVATAGNHDTLHQYTSRKLNEAITSRPGLDKDAPPPVVSVIDWFDKYFKDRENDGDPISYESWHVLNQARIQQRLEAGPQGETLQKNCEIFFDELARIGIGVRERFSEKVAHDTVDYLGTVFLHEMMRYMPLDHPLVDYALRRLEQADPTPEAITAREEEIVAGTRGDIPYMAGLIANYKTGGFDLVPENPGYAELKRLQIVEISPWIAHLLTPAQPGTKLDEVKERVSQVNVEMITSAAWESWFSIKDGKYVIGLPEGRGKAEIYIMNGVLHREDGPAFTKIGLDGSREEEWYLHGEKREHSPAKTAHIPGPTPR